jgi:hypothetical protein
MYLKKSTSTTIKIPKEYLIIILSGFKLLLLLTFMLCLTIYLIQNNNSNKQNYKLYFKFV